ncbi:ATP synthase F0 complex subunit gamma [Thermacetogenium phaeum DSM 12270]|jgi:F-type H+-transporting ATPase subunit c|uniref:ATP synthase subunit c n=2 Tax=Thermacetogenium phaeum TaxID=85874 RepID=K4LLE6_THEPS|nr:ATP synthase F0 subunit C [Thermacetogenium phaeum]MDK2880824.1 F-type H+-transporting ATPase subunit c [Clostridia bacterium]MDN5365087.1 F-type H+-transporting ATPase subunit c [Thermacetogenium sp.]AFV12907.1 ATP synthase F0 complex subunit gamma [Thermacetogenium phaeum DSM 12270]KUK36654.1 MAG: ATP synthase F0 complex subunit gamma [Thermacetogenium phaeum]MDN5376049.1 F-type H+-transporting ATPase subunit c [Thermacetogenium sp.]
MDLTSAIIALAVALVMGIATIGPALGQGTAAAKALEGMSRQPEMSGELRTTLIIAMAFMEALTIYGLLIAFLLLGKMG